jgi:nitronate monooxygenase
VAVVRDPLALAVAARDVTGVGLRPPQGRRVPEELRMAAALALGADGAWLGTRFLAATEAGVADRYREEVLAAAETDTIYSELFDGGWPGTPHRTLRNSTVERWEAAGCPPPGDRPGEGDRIGAYPWDRPIERYGDDLPVEGATGDLESMALYAGQSAGLTDDNAPAGEIVRELVAETRETIARLERLAE